VGVLRRGLGPAQQKWQIHFAASWVLVIRTKMGEIKIHFFKKSKSIFNGFPILLKIHFFQKWISILDFPF